MKKIQVSLFVFILAIMNFRQVHAINISALITACLAMQTTNAEPNQFKNTPTINPTNVPKRNYRRSEMPTGHEIHRRGNCPSCDADREDGINPAIHNRIIRDMRREFEENNDPKNI